MADQEGHPHGPDPSSPIQIVGATQVPLPRVVIRFCVQCKWNLRAAYVSVHFLVLYCLVGIFWRPLRGWRRDRVWCVEGGDTGWGSRWGIQERHEWFFRHDDWGFPDHADEDEDSWIRYDFLMRVARSSSASPYLPAPTRYLGTYNVLYFLLPPLPPPSFLLLPPPPSIMYYSFSL